MTGSYYTAAMLTTRPSNSASAVRNSVLIFMTSESFAQSLKKALEATGYHVTVATTESEALAEARASVPALIIMNRQPDSITNFRYVPTLHTVPIVAVQEKTVPCADDECIDDFEKDIDLIVCNQSVRELVARVRAILRRRSAGAESHTQLHAGHIRMDLDRHEVTINDRSVELTPKEFEILKQFLKSPSRVFSRQEMLNQVWGEGYALEEHALDVHIHSLRQKIEQNPARPMFIVTVRGIGYKLRVGS